MAAPSGGRAVARRPGRCYLRPAPGAISGGGACPATASSSGSRAAATTPPSRWSAPAPAGRSATILASEVARPGRAARRLRRRRARDRRPRPRRAARPRDRGRARRAGLGLGDLDAVAVTAGPGLIGGVLAGVMFAKGLAAGRGLPLWGVNHLAGHALTPRLVEPTSPFPTSMLLVSGGHCQFLAVEGPERFHRLGGTIDDAPGEAFDKVAKLLGLGQPGGPAVEAEARARRPRPLRPAAAAPRPRRLRPLLLRPEDRGAPRPRPAGRGAGRAHPRRPRRPLRRLPGRGRRDAGREDPPRLRRLPRPPSRRAAGARRRRRRRRQRARSAPRSPPSAEAEGFAFVAPPLALCTDNGAMIAWAAAERMAVARPRRPRRCPPARAGRSTPRAAPMLGAGRKGAKA